MTYVPTIFASRKSIDSNRIELATLGLRSEYAIFNLPRLLETVSRFFLDNELKEVGQDFLKNQPRSFQSEDLDLQPK
ncbi:hypothetical protein TNCV_2367111 [Trichonephila clavipes]|nr:hypothetical protein TNCV_2367111 [Trichonephila clavipes]